ncbi:hypothetical protein HYH03_014859 [Edaphochlamys debaryana]|uniref:Uncharacterized protein n=1 Tax=Edaphochlamys debaryana TaxID=47281 RepID=A0A835XN61_9CHLO|nr:hypothetical protein HYH03_014859 [Edaphochlamys debaryana]|eukprot:KAG2486412.1 hypothetical protein HYH03_014859 [Edaphochlamys debaryana]
MLVVPELELELDRVGRSAVGAGGLGAGGEACVYCRRVGRGRTMLVVPELELELDRVGRSAKMQEELRQLRQLRDEYDDRIQRLRWSIARGGQQGQQQRGGEGGAVGDEQSRKDAQALLEAAEEQRAKLKSRHSALLRAHHRQFHPVWGQLMKTGHQNSRFAHQLERYACLYTSHVSNIAFVSPEKSFMGRLERLAHEWEYEEAQEDEERRNGAPSFGPGAAVDDIGSTSSTW